jgi:hypothetical protein
MSNQRMVPLLGHGEEAVRRLIAKWRREAAAEHRVSFCADELERLLASLLREPKPARRVDAGLVDDILRVCIFARGHSKSERSDVGEAITRVECALGESEPVQGRRER